MLVHGYRELLDRIFGQLLVDVVFVMVLKNQLVVVVLEHFLRIGLLLDMEMGFLTMKMEKALPAIFHFY